MESCCRWDSLLRRLSCSCITLIFWDSVASAEYQVKWTTSRMCSPRNLPPSAALSRVGRCHGCAHEWTGLFSGRYWLPLFGGCPLWWVTAHSSQLSSWAVRVWVVWLHASIFCWAWIFRSSSRWALTLTVRCCCHGEPPSCVCTVWGSKLSSTLGLEF